MTQKEEWIEWGGGERPVRPEARVQAKFQSGVIDTDDAGALDWSHLGDGLLDIIAYRVVHP